MFFSQKSSNQDILLSWQVMLVILLVGFTFQAMNVKNIAYAATVPSASTAQPKIIPVVQPIATQEVAPPKPKFLSIIDTDEQLSFSESDLFCLAKNIYHEAGHESNLGKFAVAQVTINRMKEKRRTLGVCDVVFAPLQFSWATSRGTRWTKPSGPAWETSKEIAREVLIDGKRIYGMENALYFHAAYVSPDWRNVAKLVRIGNHIFYRSNR